MKINIKRNFIFLIITIFILNIFLFILPSHLYAIIQCTDYAYDMRPDLKEYKPLGNAKEWAENAKKAGFPVDNVPRAGDIAVFQPGDHGAFPEGHLDKDGNRDDFGHVAYVGSVNPDGTFNISEANFPTETDYHERSNLKVESRDRFIHKKGEISSELKFDITSSQEAEQSATSSGSNFFTVVGDWFKDLWGNITNLFIAQAAEPSTTQSVTKAASQESTQGIQVSVETKQIVTETTAPIPPPSKPSLTSPYNWYQTLGTPPLLMWQGDNNSTSYYVVVNSSNTGNVESGWINSTSWKPNLPNQNYIYTWKVKARNSQGIEGPWSDESHFSTASTTLKFEGDISFNPSSPSSADKIKIFASTTGWGGVGITLRVSVNTAPDGSTNGEWKILKELGVPKFNENDAPEWNTQGWSNGTYRVRVEAKGPNDPNWQNPAIIETTYTLTNKGTAPTMELQIYEGPIYDAASITCYYRIRAIVTGSPTPTIEFSKDDSIGSLGYGKTQVNLKNGESYTLTAKANNSSGAANSSIKLIWSGNENISQVQTTAEASNVTVTASVQWVNTGVYINVGDRIFITASGSWSPGPPENGMVGPDGSSIIWGDNFLNISDIGCGPFEAKTSTSNWAALIGYIGENPPTAGGYTSAGVISDANRVFMVGSNFTSVATLSGTLWLNFNDDAYSGYTPDNIGEVIADVKVSSSK